MDTRQSWRTRRLEKHRVNWHGQIGDILSEGRTEYFVQFNHGCVFIPKDKCTVVYGLWNRETKEA